MTVNKLLNPHVQNDASEQQPWETTMLYLTRRAGEAVIINNAIEVRVIELKGKTVKLGFNFPPTASVLREEIFEQVKRENEAAARAAAEVWDGTTTSSDPVSTADVTTVGTDDRND